MIGRSKKKLTVKRNCLYCVLLCFWKRKRRNQEAGRARKYVGVGDLRNQNISRKKKIDYNYINKYNLLINKKNRILVFAG